MTVSAGKLVTTGLRAWLGSRSSPSRFSHRVWPRYIDLNRHMNQAAYPEVMELARWDWIIRSGILAELVRARVSAVVASQSIVYRRELRPLQRFVVDTRVVGMRHRAIQLEQVFLVGTRVHTKATVELLPLSGGRVVAPERTQELLGTRVQPSLPIEDWCVVGSPS